jgi:hypothetical protein
MVGAGSDDSNRLFKLVDRLSQRLVLSGFFLRLRPVLARTIFLPND